MSEPLRVGIAGPVGAGKTTLVELLCRKLSPNFEVAVVTNDIYTQEDAEILWRSQVLSEARIVGVETGGWPHTAIREDASMNLAAIDRLSETFPELDIIIVESGGDNLSATFSPELVDLTLYIIDENKLKKVTNEGVETLAGGDYGYADGAFASAKFKEPKGIVINTNGVFVSDTYNNKIRKIDLLPVSYTHLTLPTNREV